VIVGLVEKWGFALTEDMVNVEIRLAKIMKLNVSASFLEIILSLYALLANKRNAISDLSALRSLGTILLTL
jgi:hypothetical protein